MKYKYRFLLVALLLSSIFFGQNSVDLPFKELPEHRFKKASLNTFASKILDAIGHTFYWATESLIQDNLQHAFENDNLPRLFLNGVYLMSEELNMLIVNNTERPNANKEIKTFLQLRNRTLKNIEASSLHLLNSETVRIDIDWDAFFEFTIIAQQYCDNIIAYRERIGGPAEPFFKKKKKVTSALVKFESTLGADGVSNDQWMEIMRYGGGPIADVLMRRQNRRNNQVISQLKKLNRAEVLAGTLKEIKPYSNTVEDITYTYYSQTPKQLSFTYSSDLEIVKSLIDWTVSINAGKSESLRALFRIGIDTKLHVSEKDILGASMNFRTLRDSNGNSIIIKIPKRYIQTDTFWEIPIDKVYIRNNNSIQFIRVNPKEQSFANNEIVVMTITGVDGDLLERIKEAILKSREGIIEVNNAILNLKTF